MFSILTIYWKYSLSFSHSLIDRSQLVQCPKTRICFKNKKNISSLIQEDVLLIDNRFNRVVLNDSDSLQLINQYNLTGKQLSWRDYRRIFYRLMFNPIPAITNVILEKRKELGPLENVVAVHIRCIGQLADVQEQTTLISMERLVCFPSQIKEFLQQQQQQSIQVMYLTTDSSVAEEYIRLSFQKMKVYSLVAFQRGHSTRDLVTNDTLIRSILDMYLAAQAKHVAYTDKSCFTAAISILGNAPDRLCLKSERSH